MRINLSKNHVIRIIRNSRFIERAVYWFHVTVDADFFARMIFLLISRFTL